MCFPSPTPSTHLEETPRELLVRWETGISGVDLDQLLRLPGLVFEEVAVWRMATCPFA